MNDIPSGLRGIANNMEFLYEVNINTDRVNEIFTKQHLLLKYNTPDFAYAFNFTN